MKKSVLTFVAAVLLCFTGLDAFAQSHNFVPKRYRNVSGLNEELTDTSTVSGMYYREYWLAPDSLFATGPISFAGSDSATVSVGSASVHTIVGSSATVQYLRIISRTSPSGSWDTSISIRLKRLPTIHAVVTPGDSSFTAAITAYTGNDVVPVYCRFYNDSAHTSYVSFDTFYVGLGLTTTVIVHTPLYLSPNTHYYPRFFIVGSEGTATFDTAIQTLPLPGPATLDTAAATTVTNHSVTMYFKVNTLGASGYFTVSQYDSMNHIIDSVHISLVASYSDQFFTVTFDTLDPHRRYGYGPHVVTTAGPTWMSHLYYVTRTSPAGLHVNMLSAGQDPTSGNAILRVHYSTDESIGLCDVTVLLGFGTAGNVVNSSFEPGVPGDSIIIETYQLDAQGTYYAYAYANDGSVVTANSDTLKFGAWATGIREVAVVREKATVTITNMMGQKVDEYIAMPNDPIWRNNAQYMPGIYIANVRMESGSFQQKKGFR